MGKIGDANTFIQKKCHTCNTKYTVHIFKSNSKYCSQECKPTYYKPVLIRKELARNFGGDCVMCGKSFLSATPSCTTCSKECRRVMNNKRVLADFRSGKKHKYTKTCAFCANEFKTSAPKQKFCSTYCCAKYKARDNYFNGLKRCRTCHEFKEITDFNIQSNGGGKTKISSDCRECKKSYDRLRSAKRRSLTVSVNYVNYIKVFDAYQWKCAQCGCDTPKELRGKTLPNSPELDHIMPISLGGSHDYHNVQLLCRKCNLKKSNKYAKTGTRTNGLLIQERETDIFNNSQTYQRS